VIRLHGENLNAEDTKRMNIIIVTNPGARPTSLNLRCWRARAKVAAVCGTCALGFMVFGFAAALIFANPRDHTLGAVKTMHEAIAAQQNTIDTLETASRRDLDALAIQLGALQAQATRLNALGQRLTKIGKLDDGEFAFDEAPAMGGPE